MVLAAGGIPKGKQARLLGRLQDLPHSDLDMQPNR